MYEQTNLLDAFEKFILYYFSSLIDETSYKVEASMSDEGKLFIDIESDDPLEPQVSCYPVEESEGVWTFNKMTVTFPEINLEDVNVHTIVASYWLSATTFLQALAESEFVVAEWI